MTTKVYVLEQYIQLILGPLDFPERYYCNFWYLKASLLLHKENNQVIFKPYFDTIQAVCYTLPLIFFSLR